MCSQWWVVAKFSNFLPHKVHHQLYKIGIVYYLKDKKVLAQINTKTSILLKEQQSRPFTPFEEIKNNQNEI